jgi:MoxR-like ATPase
VSLGDVLDEIAVHTEVEEYLLDLVERTRSDDRLLRGVSPRGAEALYRSTRALALSRGRDYVVPEDVRELAVPVLGHRVMARSGELGGRSGARVIEEILWELSAPA